VKRAVEPLVVRGQLESNGLSIDGKLTIDNWKKRRRQKRAREKVEKAARPPKQMGLLI